MKLLFWFALLTFVSHGAASGDDLLSSLDFARDSLMRFSAGSTKELEVLTPVQPQLVIGTVKPAPAGKKGPPIKELSAVHRQVFIAKTLDMKRQRKVYRPRASPSNKFLEAVNEIERAVANAGADTTSPRRQVSAQKLQHLIKKATDHRSYRYARTLLGHALWVMKQQSASDRRSRRTSQNSAASEFLDGLKQQLGDDKFNTFMAVQGDVTLMFAIDDTGSMSGEIEQAKKIAIDVINLERETPVDYILSPFDDPEPEPSRAVYKDETEQVQFVQAINDLTAEGGGDCPEYTFTGILRAIYEAPRWGSPMYVFTDAYPKDATDSNVDEVEALAADYGLTINFFTTGECHGLDVTGVHPAFSAIAAATNGQVFRLSNELELGRLNGLTGSVLGGSNSISIGSNISNRKRRRAVSFDRLPLSILRDRDHLLSDDLRSPRADQAAGASHHSIVVDDSIEELTISLTAANPEQARLVDPSGVTFTSGKISMSGATVYQISKPQSGAWDLVVFSSAGSYEFRAKSTSATNIDFEHFFLFTPTRGRQRNIPLTQPLQPTHPNEKAKAVLTVAGVDKIVPNSLSAELITEHGQRIADVSLTPRRSGAHFVASFTPPSQPFKLKLKGNTRTGKPFERISRSLLEAKAGFMRTLRATNEFTLKVGRNDRVTLQLYSTRPVTFTVTAKDSLGYFVGLTRSIVRARRGSLVLTSVNLRATRRSDIGKTDILFVRATGGGVTLTHVVHLLVAE